MMKKNSSIIKNAFRFSVAPMLDCTDKHFRVLMRQITKRSLLYTEMVVAKAIHHSSNRSSLLDFNEIEHPISLQVGGDDPVLLAETAKIAENWGYDEINLNIGCPSQKVQSGNFGACLMGNPNLVAKCVEAMVNASRLPVTVKHRLGIDNFDSDLFLSNFVDQVAKSGAKRFSIHARKAWLKGLNPLQNRTIPPLRYEKIFNLKKSRPNIIIELNGGLTTPEECLQILKKVDGVMVGRAAYQNPLLWKGIDNLIYGEKQELISASKVIEGLIPYAEKHISMGGKIWDIARHTLKLVQNVPGAKAWRHEMTIKAQRDRSDIEVLIDGVKKLKNSGL